MNLSSFHRHCHRKVLLKRRKKVRCGKQSKKRCTIAFFVAANGCKVCGLIVVWRSKILRCFKNITKFFFCHHRVRYFANAGDWMTTEIMQEVLGMLDKKITAEGGKVFALLRQRTFSYRHSPGRFKKHKAGISFKEYHIHKA